MISLLLALLILALLVDYFGPVHYAEGAPAMVRVILLVLIVLVLLRLAGFV